MSERGARALELAVDALKRIENAAPIGSAKSERTDQSRAWRDVVREQQRVARIALLQIGNLGKEAESDGKPEGGDAA